MIDGHSVSLLISSRNRPAFLMDALQSVLDGSTVPDEIVIIDQSDAPNDAVTSMDVPAAVRLKYLNPVTRGLSRSRNLGFAQASNPIAVILDDDCLATKQWLETIVRALLDAGPKAVVTGRVLATEPSRVGAFAPSLHTSDRPARFRGRQTTDPLATFNFALWTKTFTAVGEFDPRIGPGTGFPSAEDNDYGYRLLLDGHTIVFEPSALVYHRAWRDEATYVALRYAYGRGQGAYYAKHLAAGDWYMLWKLVHALKRRGTRMVLGGRRGVLGEAAWIAGWTIATLQWLTRPPRA
jgi:GT2 family glycosyltransferase